MNKKEMEEKIKELEDKYKEALDVLREIDKLPIVSYHLERYKHKNREDYYGLRN